MKPPTPRELFDEFRELVTDLSLPDFSRQYGGWYLLCSPSPSEPRSRLRFNTENYELMEVGDLLRNGRGISARPTPVARRLSLRVVELYQVQKTNRNSWPRLISVGRAPNNDIVLRYKTVSKLHAHFLFAPAQKKIDPVPLQLEDVGSHNGTRLNGRFVQPETVADLKSGDVIAFGSLKTELVDAAALHDRLTHLSATRR